MNKERNYRRTHPGQWGGAVPDSWEGAQVGLLAMILDELQKINSVLQCTNTRLIPAHLERIAKNTDKRKRK